MEEEGGRELGTVATEESTRTNMEASSFDEGEGGRGGRGGGGGRERGGRGKPIKRRHFERRLGEKKEDLSPVVVFGSFSVFFPSRQRVLNFNEMTIQVYRTCINEDERVVSGSRNKQSRQPSCIDEEGVWNNERVVLQLLRRFLLLLVVVFLSECRRRIRRTVRGKEFVVELLELEGVQDLTSFEGSSSFCLLFRRRNVVGSDVVANGEEGRAVGWKEDFAEIALKGCFPF